MRKMPKGNGWFNDMPNLPTANNNPGDLRFIGQTGATPGQGGFASFQDPKQGFAALLNDVQTKINNHPNNTLVDFANQYAPSSDGNDSAGYAAKLANQLGVAPNTPLKSLEPNIGKFAEAIANNEGYQGEIGDSGLTPTANAASSASASSQSSSNPSWSDWLLGGLAAGGGFLAGLAKNNSGAIESIGSGIGESVAGPAGAIAGGGITKGLLGALGLDTSTHTDIGNVSNQGQQPLDPGLQAEFALLEKQQPQTNRAAKDSYDTVMSMLPQTLKGQQLSQDPNVQEGLQTAALFGLAAPHQVNNGRANYDANMTQSDSLIGEIHDLLTKAEHASGTTAPIDEVRQVAARELKSRFPASEHAEIDKELGTISDSIAQTHGDGGGNVGTGHLLSEAVKEGRNKKYGLLQPMKAEIHKQWSLAARHAVRAHTKNKELYNRATKMERNLINAKKVMKHLNGKAVPHKKGGLMRDILHTAGRSLATAIGDKIGGVPGAIIGQMIGDTITRRIDKRFAKNLFETPGMHKALDVLRKKNPLVYQRLIFELKKGTVAYPGNKKEGHVKHGHHHKTKETHKQPEKSQAKGSPSKKRR